MDRQEMRRRIAQHPKAVRPEEFFKLLEAYGWELDRIRGSHHIFVRDDEELAVPYHRPHLLAVYVKHVLKLLEEDD